MKQCVKCFDFDVLNGKKFTTKSSVIKYFGGDICKDCLPLLERQMRREIREKKKLNQTGGGKHTPVNKSPSDGKFHYGHQH